MSALWVLRSPDEARTEWIGSQLGRTAEPLAQRALRVLLRGELGAGKTTLARGLLRSLGVQGRIRSPSYALLELYPCAPWSVLHIDLFRLRDESEWMQLGLEDFDRTAHIWLVEWPERAPTRLAYGDLAIALSVQSDAHRIEMAAGSEPGQRWLERAREAGLEPPPVST